VILKSVAHSPRLVLIAPRALWTCFKYRVLLMRSPVANFIDTKPPVKNAEHGPQTSDISRAVYFSAKLIPGTRCLAQALAVREMMHHYGLPCELQLGVATAGGFRAHAWVTSEGRIIHGQSAETFVTLQPR